MKKILLIGVLCFFFQQSKTYASLKINEIYPAPPSGEQEWVEMYNDEDKVIDLTGFTITDEKNNPLTFETNTASPSSYFLATSTNVLNNSGDSVILKNGASETIDSLTYSDSFTADKSYSRCPDGAGSFIQTNTITKRSTNAVACVTPTQKATETPVQTPTNVPPVNTLPTYDHIYISEVMVNPEEENEWIELYNDNDFSVSLKNWFIDDEEDAGSSPKSISLDIAAQSYAVYNLTSSMFNNGADAVRLLDSNTNEKDSFSYYSSVAGKTLGKSNLTENSICIMESTKGRMNGPCVVVVTPTTSTPTPSMTPTPTFSKISPYQTSIPTKKISAKPTIKKVNPTVHLPRSLFDSTQHSSPEAVKKTKGEVLGTKTSVKEKKPDSYPLWKILAAIAGFLSFLTMIIIFFRMKYKVFN